MLSPPAPTTVHRRPFRLHILQDVDQVDQDGGPPAPWPHSPSGRSGGSCRRRGRPSCARGPVAPFGLVEDLCDHRCGVVATLATALALCLGPFPWSSPRHCHDVVAVRGTDDLVERPQLAMRFLPCFSPLTGDRELGGGSCRLLLGGVSQCLAASRCPCRRPRAPDHSPFGTASRARLVEGAHVGGALGARTRPVACRAPARGPRSHFVLRRRPPRLDGASASAVRWLSPQLSLASPWRFSSLRAVGEAFDNDLPEDAHEAPPCRLVLVRVPSVVTPSRRSSVAARRRRWSPSSSRSTSRPVSMVSSSAPARARRLFAAEERDHLFERGP